MSYIDVFMVNSILISGSLEFSKENSQFVIMTSELHLGKNILLSNLTGCDGKIREAVALKVNTILSDSSKIHFFFDYPDIFADATIDINANICRLVIDSVDMLKISQDFSDIYINKIINFTNEALIELDNFIFKDKKYVINKQLFKLYWTLEAIKLFSNKIPTEVLFPILEKAAKEREYTIREKVAQILINLNDSIYNEIKNSLKQDENYYVKLVFR